MATLLRLISFKPSCSSKAAGSGLGVAALQKNHEKVSSKKYGTPALSIAEVLTAALQ